MMRKRSTKSTTAHKSTKITENPETVVHTVPLEAVLPQVRTTEPTIVEILAMQERLAQSQREADALLANLRLAKGTRDVVVEPPPPAREAVPPLPERVDAELRKGPAGTDALARALGAKPEEVASAIEVLRRAKRISNLAETEPTWARMPGDAAPAQEINEHVRQLLSDRPMTWQEVQQHTGARPNRISGAIARLQEDPTVQVINLGTKAKARWMVVPLEVHFSRIKSKA